MTVYQDRIASLTGLSKYYWPLDESSSPSESDVNGGLTSATLVGSNADYDESGPNAEEGAVLLNDVDPGYLYLDEATTHDLHDTFNKGTVELWFKTNGSQPTDTSQVLIAHRDNWFIYLRNGEVKIYFTYGGSPGDIGTLGTGLDDGEWHHLVCYWDTAISNGYVYVDKSLVQSNISTGSSSTVTSTYKMTVGVHSIEAIGEAYEQSIDAWVSNICIYPGSSLGSSNLGLNYEAMYTTNVSVTNTPNVTYSAPAPTVSAGSDTTITTTTASVTFVAPDPNVDTEGNTTPAVANTPNVTFVALDANILTGLWADVTVTNTPDLTFVGLDPTVNVQENVSLGTTLATITFTAPDPRVANYYEETEVAFDGEYQPWHSTPDSGNFSQYALGTSYDLDGIYAISDGNTGYKYIETIITIPEAVIYAELTINWQVLWSAAQSNNQFFISWDGVTDPGYIWNGNKVIGLNNPAPIVKDNMVGGDTHVLGIWYINNTSVASETEYIEVQSLSLYEHYDAAPDTGLGVNNVPNVSFTSYDVTVGVVADRPVSVTNIPRLSLVTRDPTIYVEGQGSQKSISIGMDASAVSFNSFDAVVFVESNIEQIVTNLSSINLVGKSASIRTLTGDLSFKFVDPLSVQSTANESDVLQSINLGSVLYNQEKIFMFRLGNTSSAVCDFTISAGGSNPELSGLVTFSTDKVNYSPTISIRAIKANQNTDVIFAKINVSESVPKDDGSFLINVVQTNG